MLLLIGALASLALYWLFDRVRKGRHPPELPGFYPVVGVVGHFIKGFSYDEIWRYAKLAMDDSLKIGGFGRTWFGYQTLYIVAEPAAAIKILTECPEKDNIYKFAKPWLGMSLILADVPLWQSHRKMINPAFKQRTLEKFFDAFNKQSQRLVKRLSAEVGKGHIDVFHHIAHFALKSFATTLCGLTEERIDCLDDTIQEYIVAADLYQTVAIKRLMKLQFHLDWVFNLIGGELKVEHDKLLNILHKMSKEIIETKKIQNKLEPSVDDDSKSFLDLSLDFLERKDFTEEQLQEEVDLMVFAAYDTSSTALMYTLILLGSYPEEQEKLFKEITEVLPDPAKYITKQDLARLVYTEAVLNESMRLYPPVPILGRNLHKDMKFDSCTLRAGNKCGVAVYSLHRHPVWGPHAELFRPERWLGGPPACPGAFMPFSWGRRGCIGKDYAMMSMKVVLAYLVRSYRFTADHEKMQFQFHLMMKPVSGHHVAIEMRS